MNPNQIQRAIVVLRIAVGLWFLHAGLRHLVWLPYPWATPGWMDFLAGLLTQAAQAHPIPGVRAFILGGLLPNVVLLAGLDVWLKLAAGLSLALGALTVLGGLAALTVAVAYLFLFFHMGEMALGLYGLLALCSLLFMLIRAGRAWGVDAVLASIKPRALFW